MRSLHFLRPLGAGAFGTVYLAELASAQGFRRPVAVKVLQDNRPDSDMFLTRMRDEARLLGLLQDDSILKVLEMVQVQGLDAVVMEYVEGADLDGLVKDGHRPPPRALAEVGASVAGALSRAHRAKHPSDGSPLNVVHRDVKPANIMVTRSGGVKLLDFGVARARFDARESFTGQLVLGTLNYMAPEYIVSGELSTAADVYGLALTLWEVAAGEVYGQPKVRQDAHERRLAERLARIRPTHGQLTTALERMLQWNPAARPDALAVEQQLLAAADAMTGSGLRRWATEAIPVALAGRPVPRDRPGLSGRTVQLSDPVGTPLGDDELSLTSATSGQVPAPDATDAYSALHAQPAPVAGHTRDHPQTATPAAAPAPLPPRPRKKKKKNKHMGLIIIVVQGLLLGGLFGGALVGMLVAWFLFFR